MGLAKIREIMALFGEHGRHETPVAVIQNGTLPDERSVIGTVDTIANMVSSEKLGPPAIIVVGEVVRQANALKDLSGTVVAQYQ